MPKPLQAKNGKDFKEGEDNIGFRASQNAELIAPRLARVYDKREDVNRMQSQLEIQPETAETLAAQAHERGLSVDEYLKSLLGLPNGKETASSPGEFTAALESLAETDVAPLPRDFSRDDIYFPER